MEIQTMKDCPFCGSDGELSINIHILLSLIKNKTQEVILGNADFDQGEDDLATAHRVIKKLHKENVALRSEPPLQGLVDNMQELDKGIQEIVNKKFWDLF